LRILELFLENDKESFKINLNNKFKYLYFTMKFEKSIYKKKYFQKAVKEVERDYNINVLWEEKDTFFEIKEEDQAIKVADYYIYIYNENN